MRKKIPYKANLHLQKKYGCRPEFFDFLMEKISALLFQFESPKSCFSRK